MPMAYRLTRWSRSTASHFPGSLHHFLITSCVGTDNFAGNVKLEDLQLPSDSPTGGINFITVTQLSNPRLVRFSRLRTITYESYPVRSRSISEKWCSISPTKVFIWAVVLGPTLIWYSLFLYETERMPTPIISPPEKTISRSPVFLFLKPHPLTSLWCLSCSLITSTIKVHPSLRPESQQFNRMEQ